MILAAAFATWGALAFIMYVYVGYPLLLWVLAHLWSRRVHPADITPSVTLLISAFNEDHVIKDKLENTLNLDYPPEHLEVIVVSDASTDSTDDIVKSFASRGITLLRMPKRGGKTLGLNAAMEVVRGEVIVFSDANILYRKDTIRCLVRNFADPTIGCVTGDSQYLDNPKSAAHEQENAYWGYERFIRTLESRIGSTVGGDGAIFAIRRELYRPLAPEAINDLVIPLQIVSQGFRAIFEPTAIGVEPSTGDFRKEFRRKRRIVNRSWHGVMSVPSVLNPLKMGIFSWQVLSHKVLRWLVLPLLVIGMAGCFTATRLGVVYQIGAWGFMGSLITAGLGAYAPSSLGPIARVAHGVFYFYLVNLAAFFGIGTALAGRTEMLWTPERK